MNDIMETFEAKPISPELNYTRKSAGFWMRFWAFLMDTLIISALIGLTVRPLFAVMEWSLSSSVWYAPIAIISAIIYYAYFVLMTKFFKQTLGKMAFGLRVERENGEALDWATVLFREGVGRFINNCFLHLPYLIVAFTHRNKSIADYFADTIVVHEKIYEQ